MKNKVTVGIFWLTSKDKPIFIFDTETYEKKGDGFINYEGSHFDMWDKLLANQQGGKYRGYDCYFFPRGRVLYDCTKDKTYIYADKKILDRIAEYDKTFAEMFLLYVDGANLYEYRSDEHYQSTAKWNGDKQS